MVYTSLLSVFIDNAFNSKYTICVDLRSFKHARFVSAKSSTPEVTRLLEEEVIRISFKCIKYV